METRRFGKTGLDVSILGLGGAELGYSGASADRTRKLLDGAIEAGLNVIDTAECYVDSEELIGEAIARTQHRKKVHLFTKCGHSQGYGDPDWNDPERLQASLDRSLKLLRTDYLDLFQLHSCSIEDLKNGAVIDFMERAKKSGKTRFIGYSGDGEAALFAVKSGAFDALQTSVSIADQDCIGQILPEAVKRGIGVIAKRPIANVMWNQAGRPDSYYAAYWERLKKLDYDFLRDGETSGISTALRFTLSAPGVSVAIVGTQKPGRWEENARIVAEGALNTKTYNAIRDRWKEIAEPDWVGQI